MVAPDGTLFNVFDEFLNFRNDDGPPQFDLNLSMKFSLDHGVTWLPRGPTDPHRRHALGSGSRPRPAHGTARPRRHRTQDIIADVAVDPTTGTLYAAGWTPVQRRSAQRHRAREVDRRRADVARCHQVNSTPDSLTGHNGHAFTPTVHVLPNGTMGVSYYDFRFNDPASGGTDTDHWLVHCHATSEDCSVASSWDEEVRVTPASFDSRQAPVARGFFLGDFVGLDDDGARFTAFFARGVSPANPTDIVYSEITP